jgi:hypothetical protein
MMMSATDAESSVATPAEAGFAPDLEERFEIIARQAGTLPNLHGIVAARLGRGTSPAELSLVAMGARRCSGRRCSGSSGWAVPIVIRSPRRHG